TAIKASAAATVSQRMLRVPARLSSSGCCSDSGRNGTSDLTVPRRAADLAPARADALELGGRERAGLEQRRVRRPALRLRRPDDRGVHAGHAQGEPQRGADRRVGRSLQERIVELAQARPVGLVVRPPPPSPPPPPPPS